MKIKTSGIVSVLIIGLVLVGMTSSEKHNEAASVISSEPAIVMHGPAVFITESNDKRYRYKLSEDRTLDTWIFYYRDQSSDFDLFADIPIATGRNKRK